MSEGIKNLRVRLAGKDRERELHSQIVEWRLRGMSRYQIRQLAEHFDSIVNAPPLGDNAFARVVDAALAEAGEVARIEHFKDLDEFETLPVEYLIKPIVPRGCTTIIDGNPGVGKSFIGIAMAAAITTDRHFGDTPVERTGRVLLINDEDDPGRVIRPRLEASGGDPSKLRVVNEPFQLNELGIEVLAREIQTYRPELVLIDPLTNFLPSGVDMYRPNEANAFMRPLHRLAKEFDINIVIARHLRKQASDNAMHMGQGSMAISGAVRSGLIVTQHRTHPNWRCLAHFKSSYAKEAETQAFEIAVSPRRSTGRIVWRGTVGLSANELMAQSATQESVVDRASGALEEFLADGPVKAREVIDAMKKKGIPERTLNRAKKQLGIVSGHGPGAKWRLPE